MFTTILRSALSFGVPAFAGWTVLSAFWPEGSRLLRAALGAGLGLGLAGILWMLGLLLSGSGWIALAISDGILILLGAGLWRRAHGKSGISRLSARYTALGRIAILGLILTLAGSAATVSVILYVNHHGGYDARASWNSRP